MDDTDTLQKLYLELANVVPKGCISSREINLRGALLCILETASVRDTCTVADLAKIASDALSK